MRSLADLDRSTDPLVTYVKSMVRRMTITLTGTAGALKALWQVTGVDLPSGTETTKAENYSGGIGLAARPPASNKPQAIVLMVGDAGAPVIVAAVDRATRDVVAGALKADETMLHNSKAFVHVKDDGTIEARSKLGVAVPLATKADVDALITLYNLHVHVSAAPTNPTSVPATLSPLSTGTLKLKGE